MKNRLLLSMIVASAFISSVSYAQTIKESIFNYSELVHTSYADTLNRAKLLQTALQNFTETPSILTQTIARESWKYAREAYGQTEVFRFYNGPIDRDGGPEGLLNAWPLDEAYIDYVEGLPNSGIINNTQDYPEITAEMLISLNENDGEQNISTGYHAIEFLLWGQDFYTDGPGQRPYTDFSGAPNADRRGKYLNLVAQMLVANLENLESEWRADEENFRRDFEALKETAALKKILSGVVFMAGDELSGERIYVAYDTRGQEDEQSCFSDMTHMDIQWNYLGVQNVMQSLKLLELPELKDSPLAKRIEARLSSTSTLLASIPTPFDQAIVTTSGRKIILKSVEELEALARDIADASKLLGAGVDY